VPAFAASVDFAIDKPAEHACPNLGADSRCGIHLQLRERGFRGCTVYDCFGAGQQVSQVTFGARDWRESPAHARKMFAVFPVMRQLHELLWYLYEARGLPETGSVHSELSALISATETMTAADAESLTGLDVGPHRAKVGDVLVRASRLARAARPGPDHRGADLVGARLERRNLRGADLRGAYLIGASLRQADLRQADLLGADLRDADLSGADLRGALFLVQSQLDAARGDSETVLPDGRMRPSHWAAAH
jgi:uncharacterized protein YjbI with pentapeptide repeats